MLRRGLVESSAAKQTTKPVADRLVDRALFPLSRAPSMNPRSTGQSPSGTAWWGGGAEHEPGSRSWIRQVPTPPGRCLHAPPAISVFVPSGPLPQEAEMVGRGVSIGSYKVNLGLTYSHSPNREAVSCQGAEQKLFGARRDRQDLFRRNVWECWDA